MKELGLILKNIKENNGGNSSSSLSSSREGSSSSSLSSVTRAPAVMAALDPLDEMRTILETCGLENANVDKDA